MKKSIIFTMLSLSISILVAQRANPDFLESGGGKITIQPILHGTLVLQWKEQTIYFDPYGGAKAFDGIATPTLIVITDTHGDHHDQKTLDEMNTKGIQFVVPKAVGDKLPADYKVMTMENGDRQNIGEISLEAVPMYNLPENDDSKHIKGRGNGYIITLGGKRIYVSGDTGDIPEMRSLQNIDVAFICMNLPYTMDVDQAASAVLEFKPKIVYPFHYRGSEGLSDVEKFKSLVDEGGQAIEVRLKNWYPN